MKKKMLLGACAALFLGAGITTAIHVTRAANRASAMMLENVEALAEGESDQTFWRVDKTTEAQPGGSIRIICSCQNPGGPLSCC